MKIIWARKLHWIEMFSQNDPDGLEHIEVQSREIEGFF